MRGKLALFVPAVAISVFCTLPSAAQAHTSGSSAKSKTSVANEPESRAIGTTQAFFDRLSQQSLAAKSTYDFVTPSGVTIPVQLRHYFNAARLRLQSVDCRRVESPNLFTVYRVLFTIPFVSPGRQPYEST